MQFAVQCAWSKEEETTRPWYQGRAILGVGLNHPHLPVEVRAREGPEGMGDVGRGW